MGLLTSVPALQVDSPSVALPHRLSRWSRSPLKRAFDITCVLCSLPIALPMLILTALAVRLTSRGPVLFHQQRIGWQHRAFTIYKFRTMPVPGRSAARSPLTTCGNQRFTSIGPFLRRWKLDELPQIFNVLRGDMSLVGPRPKLPELHAGHCACRPGITGQATVVFAREEVILSTIPTVDVRVYYDDVVRPLKQQLDEHYMAGATFASDLSLILRSILRQWDDTELRELLPELETISP